jgi:ABC-type Zn uptake system ZnuABC Zn-binding protein ZnuA
MKRALPVVAVLVVLTGGCRRQAGTPHPPEARRVVLCSVFPVWLIARNVAAGRAAMAVELLLPAGLGCPHEYLVAPQDVRRIERADILVVNGLGLDDFAQSQFRKAHPDRPVIVATRGLTPGSAEPNAHLFASPRLAAAMARRIAADLGAADPPGKDAYDRNAEAFARRATQVSDELRRAVADLPNKRIITQHDVFDLFARDLGLEIAGVINAHAGHDPSAAEVSRLVRLARTANVGAVMTEPQYPPRLGQTIAREAGIGAGSLDPVASGPDDAPLDYYERTMRGNVAALRKALVTSREPAP